MCAKLAICLHCIYHLHDTMFIYERKTLIHYSHMLAQDKDELYVMGEWPKVPLLLAMLLGSLRATSHTRMKAKDHCILRSLIGQKGWDHPSLLHTRRWRPKGSWKLSQMKRLHGFLHGRLWIMFHDLLEFALSPPPRSRLTQIMVGRVRVKGFKQLVQLLDENQEPS